METMNFLKGVLRCKFTYAKCPTRFRYKSNALSASPLCTRDTSSNKPAKPARGKLTPGNIQNVCKSNCNSCEKSPRIPKNKVESLFSLCRSITCTIIYLVRDPRSIIFFHVKVGIRFWGYFKDHSKGNGPRPSLKLYNTKICRQIEANFRTFLKFTWRMNDKYFMLRYEDLTRNPIETLTRGFDLTGITTHMITLEWVESHTSENNEENGYAMSTNRNSKAKIDKWRLEVDPDLVNIIEDGCCHVMLLLGYKPLNGSETMQCNLTISLYDN